MPLSRAVAALPALLLIASCSRTDPPPPPPPKAQVQAPKPAAPAEPLEAQVDPALKERLARQEAAAKMFDRKPEPPKPEAAKAEPKAEAKAEPKAEAKAEPKAPPKVESKAEPKVAEAKKPEPSKPADPPKVAAASPKAPEPARAPEPKAEPKTSPPATVASAPASAPPSSAPRIVARVDPDFPREAVKAGVDSGVVRARMTIDGAGSVTRVEIIEASPRRVFDRAVVQALTQWRFNDGAPGRMVETEVAFRR